MNPIKYLFENLKFISFETQILEACDWDDDRAEVVKKYFQDTLQSFSVSNKDSIESLKSSLANKLSHSLSEKEVEACLCIFEKCITDFSNIGDLNYEN